MSVTLARVVARTVGRHDPSYRQNTLIVGAGQVGQLMARKVLHHPTKGVIAFDHASFQFNDDPSLKLVIYTPVLDRRGSG